MMVSIPRSSIKESDSEDGSDSEEDREDEAESEVGSDSDEDERSDTPEEDSAEEGDDEFVEAEKEDVEMTKVDDVVPGSPEALEHTKPPHPNRIEGQIPKTVKVAVPTLRRQDAQNPILEMSPKHVPTIGRTPLKPATRRRSSRLQQQQVSSSDELLRDTIANMTIDKPQEKERRDSVRRRSAPARDSDDDDSWRPREPITSTVLLEVENDEIIDPPSPVPNPSASNSYMVSQQLGSSRRLSRIASQALQFVNSRPTSPQQPAPINTDSQGSVELGDTQRLLRGDQHAYIPETQFSKPKQEPEQEAVDEGEEEVEPDVLLSQVSFVPQSSYFEQASQNLQEPVRRPNVVRTKSMPASMHTPRAPERPELIAGGITIAEAFQYTISPSQSRSKSIGGVRGTLLTATPGSEKSLRTLTRQASRGLGTLPSSTRKRMVSLPFVPPFKK